MNYAVGVDLGGTNLRAGLVSSGGEILDRVRRPTRAGEGFERVLDRIVELVGRLLERHSESPQGLGVGIPGTLDPVTGYMYKANNLPGCENIPLREILEQRLELPVTIENDAHVAVLAEAWCGAARGARDVVMLTLGTGIGGGILVNGRLLSGARKAPAEVGHLIIRFDGEPCSCGARGCLEAYCGAAAIVKRTREALRDPGAASSLVEAGEELSVEQITEAARRQDSVALQVLEQTGDLLGVGVTSLVNLFAPEVVILGGGVSNAGALVFEPMRRRVRREALEPARGQFEVRLAALGSRAGLVGAAGLILNPSLRGRRWE